MEEDREKNKKVKIAKIKVDRELCIGAASCVAVAPSVFEIDPENKAVMKRKVPPPTSDMTEREELEDQITDDETLILSAKSCPTQAIFLYDEEGNQIFP